MDGKYKKLLKDENKKFNDFRNEPPFEASSFAEEIVLLLGDYFVGNFALRSNAIICSFANGQQFRILIEEEKCSIGCTD